MTAHSYDSIRQLAQKFRERLGVEHQDAPDMFEVLQKFVRLSPKITLVTLPDFELPLVEAQAEPEPRRILVRASVFAGLKHADPRARWILAHEIGHFVLHHKGAEYRNTNNRFVVTVEKQQEREAQRFATEFLMPRTLVARFHSASEIAKHFHVPLEMARIRLEDLKQGSAPASAPSDRVLFELKLFSIDDLPPSPSFRAPAEALTTLAEQGYSEEEIFEFVVPKRTLARRRAASELLTVDETDRALRLKRIGLQAQSVFGNAEKANRWLRKPKRELKGETPLAYLASEAGARVVEEMLYRIEHGIFA